MHSSIIQTGSQLERTTQGLQLGCHLCPKFTTTREKTILKHLGAHIENAVHFHDKIICRCNQPCRGTGHYHCPYCAKTMMRKEDLMIHVIGCQKLSTAVPPSAEIIASVPSLSVGFESVVSVDCSNASLSASVQSVDHSYTLSLSASVKSVESSDKRPQSASVDLVDASDTHTSASGRSIEVPSSRVTFLKSVKCPHCSVVLYKKNLSVHIERKHASVHSERKQAAIHIGRKQKRPKDVTATSHLQSVCVDQARGLFAISKDAHGSGAPIHVQHKTWGKQHVTRCELEDCRQHQSLAQLSGLRYHLCEHIQSLDYCSTYAIEEPLEHTVLNEIVACKFFRFSKVAVCKKRQKTAEKTHAPLSVLVDIGGSQNRICLSIHEPKISQYCSFGRVMVTYNRKKNTWHCPCVKVRMSCPHKNIAKWHLIQTRKELFMTAGCTTETSPENMHSVSYPAKTGMVRSLQYVSEEVDIGDTRPGLLVQSSSSIGVESVVTADHSYALNPSASVENVNVDPLEMCARSASVQSIDPSDTLSPSASLDRADASLVLPPSASVESIDLSVIPPSSVPVESIELPSSRVTFLKSVKCPHCPVVLYKKNLLVHIERKHGRPKETTAASPLQSVCVDQACGLFAVSEGTHLFTAPIHVQRRTWGVQHVTKCESEVCQQHKLNAQQSGLRHRPCEHILSLNYCSKNATEEPLNRQVLDDMVACKFLRDSKVAMCKKRQRTAEKTHAPLSVLVDVGGSHNHICISIHEPTITSYCCLGRVMVTYNRKKNTWNCPCVAPRKSCPHKNIARWHLFQTQKELFMAAHCTTVTSSEETHPVSSPASTEPERNVQYVSEEINIADTQLWGAVPDTLPEGVTTPGCPTDYPSKLVPTDTTCKLCSGNPKLEEVLHITDNARIVGMKGVIQNISTYKRRCAECQMIYRYQEWSDGLLNFNDHLILTLQLCLYLRHNLQNHVSVSRVISHLEGLCEEQFPATNLISQAYCHFESLCNRDNTCPCVTCRPSSPEVALDLRVVPPNQGPPLSPRPRSLSSRPPSPTTGPSTPCCRSLRPPRPTLWWLPQKPPASLQ